MGTLFVPVCGQVRRWSRLLRSDGEALYYVVSDLATLKSKIDFWGSVMSWSFQTATHQTLSWEKTLSLKLCEMGVLGCFSPGREYRKPSQHEDEWLKISVQLSSANSITSANFCKYSAVVSVRVNVNRRANFLPTRSSDKGKPWEHLHQLWTPTVLPRSHAVITCVSSIHHGFFVDLQTVVFSGECKLLKPFAP